MPRLRAGRTDANRALHVWRRRRLAAEPLAGGRARSQRMGMTLKPGVADYYAQQREAEPDQPNR